jgi:hypothetical protein
MVRWSKCGAGQNKGAWEILLDRKVELGWPLFNLATAAAGGENSQLDLVLEGGRLGWDFIGDVLRTCCARILS